MIIFQQSSFAATTIPFTINMSESVNVTGTPRIAVDVGGVARYATYASGTGTSALTFNYAMTAGDVDLDGVTLSSPIDLNGGTLKDLNGNNATLTFTVPNTSNVKVNYPSLGMDFTNGTSGRYTLNGTVYNSLSSFLTASGGTFTRNSIGTYFDSTGTLQTATANTPRFDYDPVTNAAKGILIEESRTNLIRYSTKITNRAATGFGYSGDIAEKFTIDSGIAPDGTNTASYANVSSFSRFFQEIGGTNTTYTMSVWLKAGSGTTTATLNIKNFASDTIKQTATVPLTTTWQRFSITGTTDGSSAGIRAEVSFTTAIYAWGFQVEQGSFPTSYIPTTTAAVTRQTEIINIPTGTWYNQSTGSFINDVSWASSSGTGFPMFLRVDDTTSNNRWNAFYNQSANSLGIDAFAGGSSQGGGSNAASTSGTAKIASAQTLNNANFAFNGTLKTLDTSWTPPTVTRLFLGSSGTNHDARKWFKTLKYYPTRVSDTQLQLLTQ